MAILKRFLCLCNTRTGSLVSGCYTLAVSLICLVYYLFRYVGHKLVEDSAEYKGIIYVGFVLYGFMIVSSLIIIPGVQLDKRYLLLPWVYILILIILYDTGSVALLTTVHVEREKTLHEWEIIWVFFYVFRLAANCYCFACVVSQYQELSDGRGTYDYLYKPHRRSRVRRGTQFDLDTYDLPFGIHLPPYCEEDTTLNSPPTYDKIYPQTSPSPGADCVNSDYADIELIDQSSSEIVNQSRNLCDSYGDLDHCMSQDNCPFAYSNIARTVESLENPADIYMDSSEAQSTCETYNRYHHHHHHHCHHCQHLRHFHRSNHESCVQCSQRVPSRNCYEVTVNVEWI